MIEVSPVKPGDGVCVAQPLQSILYLANCQSHLYSKSEISVTDQDSKGGTTVDGEHIRGQTKTLEGDEHTLKLGKYQHLLR